MPFSVTTFFLFFLDPSYFRVLDDDVYEACGLSMMQSTRFWDTPRPYGGDENSHNFVFDSALQARLIGTVQEKEYLTSEGDVGMVQAVS